MELKDANNRWLINEDGNVAVLPTGLPVIKYGLPSRTEHDRIFAAGECTAGLKKHYREMIGDLGFEYCGPDYEIEPDLVVDIYVPEKKVAFDFGLVFDELPSRSYRQRKYIRCKELGIRLITFFEDQVITLPSIVKSMIYNRLGVIDDKVGARKCVVKEVPLKARRPFFNANHIQGDTQCQLALGLYHNDELVSCMTFGKRYGLTKIKRGGEWELIRFANKKFTSVPGGASKLFKYFVRHYNPVAVVSYSSCDISDGNVYGQLGFIAEDGYTSSYWYVDMFNLERYHRASFMRKRIAGYWGLDRNDRTWTESIIMSRSQFIRMDDCGKQRWDWVNGANI